MVFEWVPIFCNIRLFAFVCHTDLTCVVYSIFFSHYCAEIKKEKQLLLLLLTVLNMTRVTSTGEKLKFLLCVAPWHITHTIKQVWYLNITTYISYFIIQNMVHDEDTDFVLTDGESSICVTDIVYGVINLTCTWPHFFHSSIISGITQKLKGKNVLLLTRLHNKRCKHTVYITASQTLQGFAVCWSPPTAFCCTKLHTD